MKTDNTMTAREKFLEVMGYDGPPWIIGLMESHTESYKSALRKAIEGEMINGFSDWGRGFDEGLKKAIEKLDTVLPNNPE